jgi:hypothetical protein
MNLLSPALSLDIQPTLEDVKKALLDIQTVKQDPLVILKRTEMTYLQTTYSADGYALECQFESTDKHFKAKGTFTHEAIVKAFELYFKGDTSWKQGIAFEQMNASQPFIFRLGYFLGNAVKIIGKLFNHSKSSKHPLFGMLKNEKEDPAEIVEKMRRS